MASDGTIEAKEELMGGERAENEGEVNKKNEVEIVFNFDSDPLGGLPANWSNQKTGRGGLGKWEIMKDTTAPSAPNVLAQIRKENPG